MRIQLDISIEEIELHLEGLRSFIITIGQKLNIENLRESINKLEKISKEIDKIEQAINKGGAIHKIYREHRAIDQSGIYIDNKSLGAKL